MKLVTIDTPSRHASLSKFAKSIFGTFHFFKSMHQFESDYDPVINVEHWTSAMGEDSGGNWMSWCNGKISLNVKETNWKGGKPHFADGRCVFVQFSNSSANLTTFSLGDCTQKRKFLCEVFSF